METKTKTCKCCGVVLSSANIPLRFDDIKGQEHVKRALEIAIVGKHAIVFVSEGNPQGCVDFANIARTRYDIPAFAVNRCPCGNLYSPTRTCTCSHVAIAKYQKRPNRVKAMRAGELFVYVPEVSYEKLTSSRPREADEAINERINRAQNTKAVSTEVNNSGAQSIMKAALRQLELNQRQQEQLLHIAATIARMAEHSEIHAADIAEAVMYRNKEYVTIEGIEE